SHYCGMDVFQMARKVAFVAPGRIINVGQEVIPEIDFSLELLFPEFRQRTSFEKEAVAIWRSKIKPTRFLVKRIIQFLAKESEEIEIVNQPKSAAVQNVVAIEQIDRWGLRRHRLKRRV